MQVGTQAMIKILQYRNGLYQGEVKGNKRHGQGILISDENVIIVSNWKNDVMSGKGVVFLNTQEYGFGEFNRGEIEGSFLFRGRNRSLFGQFNMSRPINKLLYFDYEHEKVEIIVHKTPISDKLDSKPLTPSSTQSSEIFNCLNIKFPCYPLLEFLRVEICQQSNNMPLAKELEVKSQNHFRIKPLNNGNSLFYFNDETSPTCLGFCLNKSGELISSGMYVGDKLNGLGCKYENGVRYEGMFESGFVNGIGLKYSQGKYSFGEYQNGNLNNALYVDDRSSISQQKLQEFKKLYHLRSIWHQNSYIRRNFIKFRGFSDLVLDVDSQQQYLHPQKTNLINSNKKQNSIMPGANLTTQLAQMNRTNSKNLNNSYNQIKVSNSKNLALNMMMKREGDKLETKSSREFIGREPNLADSNVRNEGKTVGGGNGKRNNFDREDNEQFYRNPQDDDDSMIDDGRSSRGLANLKKYNIGNFK